MKATHFAFAALALGSIACGKESNATFDIEVKNADKAITVAFQGEQRVATIQDFSFNIAEVKLIGEKVESFFVADDLEGVIEVNFDDNDELFEIFDDVIEADKLYNTLELTLAEVDDVALQIVATADLDAVADGIEETTIVLTAALDDLAVDQVVFENLNFDSVGNDINSEIVIDISQSFAGIDFTNLVIVNNELLIDADNNNNNDELETASDNLFNIDNANIEYIYNINVQE